MQKLILGLFILLTSVYVKAPMVENPPLVVLELFTSQGCSSCPPADVLLEQVKDVHNEQIIALSYHVDYWNYIGWQDPFSSKDFSNKQRQYASKFNSSSIYTPQIVVNGKTHFVGSNKAKMRDHITSYAKELPTNTVEISNLKTTGKRISFNYKVDGMLANKGLNVLLTINERITQIKRGENRNRTLKNANIVVQTLYIALNDTSGTASITIPELVTETDKLSIVALVQSKNLDITGGVQKAL
jgi:hypothetical protein